MALRCLRRPKGNKLLLVFVAAAVSVSNTTSVPEVDGGGLVCPDCWEAAWGRLPVAAAPGRAVEDDADPCWCSLGADVVLVVVEGRLEVGASDGSTIVRWRLLLLWLATFSFNSCGVEDDDTVPTSGGSLVGDLGEECERRCWLPGMSFRMLLPLGRRVAVVAVAVREAGLYVYSSEERA
jgi:hypothetical protein